MNNSNWRLIFCKGFVGSRWLPALALLMVQAPLLARASDVDAVLQAGVQKIKAAQSSQARVDETLAQTEELLRQFQLVNKQIDGLRVYNAQMDRQIEDQQRTMAEIETSIENASRIEREIIPLSLDMLDALEQFVRLDLPFRQTERLESVAQVRKNIGSGRFSAAEKYRQVLELYAIESDYSGAIDHYAGVLDINGTEWAGDFLRVGRVALLFQSTDQQQIQAWDRRGARWQALAAGEYRRAVTEAIRMAKNLAPADLIRLPIPAPEAEKAS